MKILIVNELLISGGAEQSCLKMKKLLNKNNEVVYLNFDNDFETKINEVDDKRGIINIKLGNCKINKYIFNYFLYKKIRNKIKEINPDKIILNNLASSPITQIKAMKGYDVYQIIRDYYAVCPKSTCIKENCEICKGYKYDNCLESCNRSLKMFIKLRFLKKMEKIRKEIVKKVISPSEKLYEYLNKFGYNSCCINNPVEVTEESKSCKIKKLGDIKKYLYLGTVSEIKGIYRLIEAYNEFSRNKEVELVIVGKCAEKEDEEKINKIIEKNSKIKYLGYKTHKEVEKLFKQFNYIVVPSLWIENYPTTALEGMLYKCVVIGSNRGGIPEIVGDNRGFLFDILDKKSIKNSLEKSYNLSDTEYSEIINRSYDYVMSNNSYDKYYKNIMQVLRG